MKILILEDSKRRHKAFRAKYGFDLTIVETTSEAIELLESQEWDTLFLDHDLGGETMVDSGSGTGYEVAKWLSEHPERKPRQIILHSYNPVGRANMKAALPEAEEAPGIWL